MRTFLDDVIRDIHQAWRLMRRTRGFTLAAVAVLAMCIGANTAVFSVVNALLLRPLPFPDAGQIVQVVITHDPSRASYTLDTSIPKFFAWKQSVRIFSHLAAYQAADPGVNLIGAGPPEHLSALHVSQDYFGVFGARPLFGRTFRWQEDRPRGPHVAVLSHGFWMRRFGGDPGVIGRVLPLGGASYEIVGVLGAAFRPDPPADVYLPLQADPFSLDFANSVRVVGRMFRNVTAARAGGQLANTSAEFRVKFPLSMGPWEDFWAVPLRDAMIGDVKPALRMLTGAVAFVLLIGCANVATLLLARGQRRRREIATRTALGAQRSRVIRQLLTESTLLAAGGGLLGLAAGAIGLRAIVRAGAHAIPSLARDAAAIVLDPAAVWFTAGIALTTGVLFGVLPALTTSRVDLSSAFKDGGIASGGGWRRHRTQSALVVAEMALAIVLLVGCGLMVRTLSALRDVDRGFDPRQVMVLDTSLSGTPLQQADAVDAVFRNARQRLAGVPGIAAVAASRSLPLEPAFALPFVIDRRPVNAPFEGTVAWRGVSPGYFDVFRIPLLRGRVFVDHDDRDGEPVVIVNAALARRYWQTNDPVGETITIGPGAGPEFRDSPRRIIGVVADPRDEEQNRNPEPTVYVPLGQVSDAMTLRNNRLFPLTWSVRTEIEPRLLRTAVERELRDASGGLPVARTRTMDEILAGPARRAAFHVTLMTAFAVAALILAAVGFYGLMSYSVQQRTQEIGIRMALGALPEDVRNMILVQGLRLAAAGVVFGVGAALVLTRVMVSLVFGVRTYDPAVFAAVALLLTVVAAVAALIPAYRATRVDPLAAIR
ncbi:MAG TPA: ABC transporter permease [Vicinamibacterales bacterium]|nr:ABC transporter permease [Vicinamibacterales bacterium]